MKIARTIMLGLVVIGSAVSTEAATKHAKTVAATSRHCSSCKAAPHAGVGVHTERVPRAQPRRVVVVQPKPKEMRVISLVQGK